LLDRAAGPPLERISTWLQVTRTSSIAQQRFSAVKRASKGYGAFNNNSIQSSERRIIGPGLRPIEGFRQTRSCLISEGTNNTQLGERLPARAYRMWDYEDLDGP
jgi:hypothetical protein